jgi:uncharacterized protein (TIGR03437 family)
MNLSRFKACLLAGLGLAIASGQTQDNSGNSLLKGNYEFRNVAVQTVDANGNPTQVTATYGSIVFDGAGNYTITGMQVDNTVAGGAPQVFTTTGIYAIAANGTGYVSSPLYSGTSIDSYDYEYGAVSQGVFAGSATEAEGEGYVLNDIFIAIPVGAAPTNASFTSAYQTGLLDLQNGGSASTMNALFSLTPNGKGNFGTITLSGQASNQAAPTLTQTVLNASYNFNSDGSATLTIPAASGGVSSTNDLFIGQKTMFQSADGNFILGWTSIGYDIFFGVKGLASPATNSITQGLYFTTALEDSVTGSGTDSYYGGDSISGDTTGDAIIHARLNFPNYLSYDYGSDDIITLNSSGATPAGTADYSGYTYLFGDSGKAFVAIGTGGNYSLVVGLHAAAFSGTGGYLNPVGVANAASYQPITASLAPGELIVLTGSGLYTGSGVNVAPAGAFPSTLGGVSVTIDSIPAPIYYVSSGQIAVVAPYGLASNTTGLANIQVTNNSAKSNVVQMYLTDAAPGSFSQGADGIGIAAALHATTAQLITPANPVQPGEYISLFLTGLGTVTPAVSDGALGPVNPLSIADVYTAGNLTVYFNDYTNGSVGNLGTIQFAGLAPSLAGLYQINVQVPTGVLGSGDSVYVEFVTDFADVNQIQVPYAAGPAAKTAARVARMFGQAHAARKAKSAKPAVRRERAQATAHVCNSAEPLSTRRGCIP